MVKTSAEKDIIIQQKEEQIKTLREQILFLKSNQETTLKFSDSNCFDEAQMQYLMSIPGDRASDSKFSRTLVRFMFSTWEAIPTLSELKSVRPSLLTTMQRMIIERVAYYSKDSTEFTERSIKNRISKIISSAIYNVKANTGENKDKVICD